MRLSDGQREALVASLEEARVPDGTKVFLYGSRLDEDDTEDEIDLLVAGPIKNPKAMEKKILKALKKRLDEQLDIVVLNTDDPRPGTELFVRTVDKERIL